jgi:hypothetical protein
MKTLLTSISLGLFTLFIFESCKKTEAKDQDIAVYSYSNVELGSQNNPIGCFLSLREGKVYTAATGYESQGSIDLIFWYNRDTGGASSTATWFTSPASTLIYYGAYHQEAFIFGSKGLNVWQTLNATEIGHLAITAGQFESIEFVGQLTSSFNSDARVFGNAISPKVNDILRFKTYNGKLAIMHVKSITGNASSTTGKITVDIKVQP